MPVDASRDDPVNWIANSSIAAAIKAINARHVMGVADSRYSGKLMRGIGDHPVFSAALICALKQNKGILNGTQLFEQVRKPVMKDANQTPEYADIHKVGHDGGYFLFVRC